MKTKTQYGTNLENYFVLYNRNSIDETIPAYNGTFIYLNGKDFTDKNEAVTFAKLHSPSAQNKAIVVRTLKDLIDLTDYKEGDDYIVAAYTAIRGTGASNRDRYVVVRCDPNNLESLTEKLVNTNPTKMYLGLEEKVDFNALDKVKSVNYGGRLNNCGGC